MTKRVSKLLLVVAVVSSSASGETQPRLSMVDPGVVIPDRNLLRFADVDGDGDKDILYLAGTGENSEKHHGLFVENLGDRQFSDPIINFYRYKDTFTSGSSAPEPYLGDITGDGLPDALISERSHTQVRPVGVRLASAQGHQRQVPLSSFRSQRLVPADVDENGVTELIEIIQVGADRSSVRILHRQPSGTYSDGDAGFEVEGILAGERVTVIDLDGDGLKELVLSDDHALYGIIKRTGPNTFSSQPVPLDDFPNYSQWEALYSSGQWADLDNDGLPELWSELDFLFNARFAWFKNTGDFTFHAGSQNLFDSSAESPKAAQVIQNTNGPASLAVVYETFESFVSTLRLRVIRFGTWEMIQETVIDLSSTPGDFHEIHSFEDLDDDGYLDLLIRVEWIDRAEFPKHSRLAIAWGSESGLHPSTFITPPPFSHQFNLIGDFTGNGLASAITGPNTEGDFLIAYFNPFGSTPRIDYLKIPDLHSPLNSPIDVRITGLHSADFNGDTLVDLLVDYAPANQAGADSPTICALSYGLGDGTYSRPVLPDGSFDYLLSNPCQTELSIDWDKDGDLDVLTDRGSWRENILGAFPQGSRPLLSTAPATDGLGNPLHLGKIRAGDLDGDGNPDIISVAHRLSDDDTPQTYPKTTLLGIGFGDGFGGLAEIRELDISLASSDLLGNPYVPGDALMADVNADGHADLCTREIVGSDFLGNAILRGYWRRNPGNGSRDPETWSRFELPDTAFPSSPMQDFDGDGSLEWVSPTGFIKPTTGGPLGSAKHDFASSLDLLRATYVGSMDFDYDGDADFLYAHPRGPMTIVRNLTIDERSGITFHLIGNGVPPHLANPGADADGDGETNENEILVGTNPLVPNSKPLDPFGLRLTLGQDGKNLSYYQPGGSILDPYSGQLDYQIEYSKDLRVWLPLSDDGRTGFQLGSGAYLNQPITLPEKACYFRMNARHVLDH